MAMDDVILGDGQARLICGDCREALPTIGNVDAAEGPKSDDKLDCARELA